MTYRIENKEIMIHSHTHIRHSDHFSDHRTQIQNTQERRRRRNMTKECVAIKTGMLLKYADEPS